MMDLLPLNATRQERALSLAAGRACCVPTAPIRNQWNPATCPVESLAWLAWALSVTPWNSDWTESQKRAAIAASIGVHRLRGTIGGLKQALIALGYEVEIDEDTGTPFVFDVVLTANSQTTGDNSEILADAERIILGAKNARSSLGTLSFSVKSPGVMTFGCAALCGVEVSVYPAGYPS